MWSFLPFLSLLEILSAEITAPGIDRIMSDGVTSVGYNLVYGDEDFQVYNEVVKNEEKMNALKNRFNLNEALPPLPAVDVKCLMSVDRYCSKSMREMKSVLIEALKDDCAKCSKEQKENAGRVVASMMAHDPSAWKLFLTRSSLQVFPEKKPPKRENYKYKIVGPAEDIVNSRNRYTMPGVKVRVKRYVVERVNYD
ncbi:uncharacterized protein LOC125060522 [Pieris napi]|uniref:uncharacterized protein LOC125060522 n=1 Tax=Pieris napi TaxID=78633 RepID=UPI001FB898F0|nr:uncharacterized protein LOC125060522 [Pieris napi]